jgi:hypothetical protein
MFRVVVAGSPGLRTFKPLRDALHPDPSGE